MYTSNKHIHTQHIITITYTTTKTRASPGKASDAAGEGNGSYS